MEDKAYGIYEGCIFEGGGTGRVLYKSKEEAVAEAEKTFEDVGAKSKKMFYEKDRNHYEQYKWRKCDEQENRWHNTVNEIEVVEYTIK